MPGAELWQVLVSHTSSEYRLVEAWLSRIVKQPPVLSNIKDLFRTLFERLNDWVVVIDSTQRIIDCNWPLLTNLGYSRSELLDFPWDRLLYPDTSPGQLIDQSRLWAGELITASASFRSKQGRAVPVEINAHRFTYLNQSATLLIANPATPDTQFEAVLYQNGPHYNLAAQIARIGIWDWEIATDRTTWFGAMYDIYGITPSEFTGKGNDYINFTRSDYREAQVSNIERTFKAGYTEAELAAGKEIRVEPKELCLVLPNGNEHYTLGDAIAIVDEAGRPLRMVGVTIDITDIKRAEQQIREKEEKFAKSFYENPAPMQIVNVRTGARIAMNASCYRLMGYTEDDMLEKSAWDDHNLWRDPTAQREAARQILDKGVLRDFPAEFVTESGEIRNVLVSGSMLDFPTRELMILSFIDVTERTRAEAEIRRRDALMEAVNTATTHLLRASDWRDEVTQALGILGQGTGMERAGLFKVYRDDRTVYRATLLYEWAAPGIPSVRDDPRLQNIDLTTEGFETVIENALRGESAVHYRAEGQPLRGFILPDVVTQLTLPVLVSSQIWGALVMTSSQKVTSLSKPELNTLHLAADMLSALIERRQAEENEERRRKIAETLVTATSVINASLDLNRVMEQIVDQLWNAIPVDRVTIQSLNTDELGERLHVKAMRGLGSQIRLGGEIPLGPEMPHHQIITTKQPLALEDAVRDYPHFRVLDPTYLAGSWLGLPLLSREQVIGLISLGRNIVRPFSAEEIQLAIAFANHAAAALENARLYDQIQQHATELERRVHERTAELESANEELRLLSTAKDRFVSNVSHELRTPITSLTLRHYLLKQNPSGIDKHLPVLMRETTRLSHIIDDLLTLSRLDQNRTSFSLVPTNLNRLVGQFTEDRRMIAEQHALVLEIDVHGPPLTVQSDTNLLEQALSVLLTNAINYTPAGGRIHVGLGQCTMEGQEWATVRISDTGPGITAADQKRLFTRFFRGSAGQQSGVPGTGLGLSIAREIIERHAGRITIESAGIPGQGCTFCVWLPMHMQ